MDWAIQEKGYSQRRGCALFGMDPRTYRRKPKRADDGPLRKRIKEITDEHHRYGGRRVHHELVEEGWPVGLKKVRRLYKAAGLALKKRCRRRRATGSREAASKPQRPNQRWSLDFMQDAFA